MMTNDTTTLNGALTELGETLAENLTMKGINANAEDGLTTLANKIKDIRFDLSAAALTLTASTEEVLLKDSVELSARLVNQNNAPICGAVVLFKTDLLADSVIGHAVTNDDGVATFEYVVDAYGVYDFYAEFLGIEQCTSQQATVTCDYNLVLSADKDILSYNDSDSCTITGILDSETGLVENEEINYSIMHNETELDSGTLTTDENGEIVLIYDSTGAGDVNVIFSLGEGSRLLQKTYVITDYYEIVDCSNPKGVTSQNWSAPVEITGQVKANGSWGGTRMYGDDTAHHYVYLGQNSSYNDESAKIFYSVPQSWTNFKVIINDGTVSLYIQDNLIKSVNCDTTGTAGLWAGSNVNPVSLSDVKIKAL